MHLLGEQDLLGGVLAEAAQPEHRQKRVAIGKAHEQPVRAALQGLVAKVLDERGRDILGLGRVDHL